MNTGTILIVDDNKGVFTTRTSARKLLQQDTDSFESKSDHRPADNAPHRCSHPGHELLGGYQQWQRGTLLVGTHPADGSQPTRGDADRLRRCGTCR